MLETAGIPFIGSASLESTIAADKALTRSLLTAHNLPCPPGILLVRDTLDTDISKLSQKLEYPCVVKPTTTENSVGMTLVRSEDQLEAALEKAFQLSPQIIVDKFIAGREMRCSVIEITSEDGRTLVPTIPQEYGVRKNDLRTFEDKLAVNERGMPLGKNRRVTNCG